MPENDGRQLDLFDDRTMWRERARRALREFDLAEAKLQLETYLAHWPDDAEARQLLAAVAALFQRLVALKTEMGDPVAALLRLGDDLRDFNLTGWHRRLAAEAEQRYGAGCDIAGTPAGLHWLAAGEPERAAQSLRDSLRAAPEDARLLAYLGDALFVGHDVEAARDCYLRAFLLDPAAIDLPRLADPAVRDLPAAAEVDYEICGDFLDWALAVGTVEKIFPLPAAAVLPGLSALPAGLSAPNTPGRSFYRLILEHRAARSDGEKVALRRKMNALCPPLFAKFLERFS